MRYLFLEKKKSAFTTMFSSKNSYSYRGYNRYRKFGRYGRGRYGSVSGIKRSQIPTKITRQEVATIAKKAVTKDEEMKMFDNSYNSSMTQGAWYVTNLFSGWTQNVSSEGHVGRKIKLQGLRFRVRMASNAISGGSGAVYRFMVFKTSQQLTASTSSSVVQGNLFRTNPALFDVTSIPDPQSIDVIADKSGYLNPNTTSTTQNDVVFFSLDIPFKRVLNVLGENGSYFKEDNYYVYFGLSQDNGTVTTSGFAQWSWQVCYTDA